MLGILSKLEYFGVDHLIELVIFEGNDESLKRILEDREISEIFNKINFRVLFDQYLSEENTFASYKLVKFLSDEDVEEIFSLKLLDVGIRDELNKRLGLKTFDEIIKNPDELREILESDKYDPMSIYDYLIDMPDEEITSETFNKILDYLPEDINLDGLMERSIAYTRQDLVDLLIPRFGKEQLEEFREEAEANGIKLG